MSLKAYPAVLLLAALALGSTVPAQAQFAVIDIASVTQLVNEVRQLEQQVATAKNQLLQAQSAYAAITGNRGMQNLLAGTVRNYLPPDWTQLSQVMSGSSTSFPALASSVSSLVTTNAILTPSQVALLSPTQQAALAAARQNPALLASTTRSALTNSSARFADLQTLISTIGSASDEKGSLDLTARITAEQAMLQNESTKLQLLYQVAQSQEWARVQRVREQAIADQGSMRTLSPMGL